MDQIPSEYWMIIIGVLAALLGYILYYMAILVKEAGGAIRDSREIIRNSNKIVADSSEIVASVKGTVNEVNEAVLVPARGLGNIINSFSSFLSGLVASKKE
jgi:hypothetical protein